MTELPKYNYLITQFRVIITYIRLLFFPVNQSLYYDYPVFKTFFEIEVILSFLFLLSILGFTIYLYLWSRKMGNGYGILISFGIFWFFITLSVESSIIPIKDVIFEHRLYLPSIGFILAVVSSIFYGFEYLEKKFKKSLSIHLLSFIGIMTIVLLSAAYHRNNIWKTGITLYEDSVQKAPGDKRPHNDLGNIYAALGRLNEAMQEYLTALRIDPNFAIAHIGLGKLYAAQGKFDKAIEEYMFIFILKGYPNSMTSVAAHNNLGVIYYEQGRFNEAVKEYLIAMRLNPYRADVHFNLGIVYAEQGALGEAIKEYQTALRLEPDFAEAHNNLGNVYAKNDRLDEAVNEYLTALKLKPDYQNAHNNLEIIYKRMGGREGLK